MRLCSLLGCWSADVQGLEYSAEPKAQIILQLLGAYSVVEHPLAMYLTNGAVYHRVTLIGKEVVCWRNLTPQAALHCVVQELEKVRSSLPLLATRQTPSDTSFLCRRRHVLITSWMKQWWHQSWLSLSNSRMLP